MSISDEGTPQMADCRFHDNNGWGLLVENHGRGWLERCFFWSNKIGAWTLGASAETEMRACEQQKPQ